MGSQRYLVFYLLGGIAAALFQIAVIHGSNVPMLGASGAIAAVMGAFIITYPSDRIRVLLVIFIYVTVTSVPAIDTDRSVVPAATVKRDRIADRSTDGWSCLHGSCGGISVRRDRCPPLRAKISGRRLSDRSRVPPDYSFPLETAVVFSLMVFNQLARRCPGEYIQVAIGESASVNKKTGTGFPSSVRALECRWI